MTLASLFCLRMDWYDEFLKEETWNAENDITFYVTDLISATSREVFALNSHHYRLENKEKHI